MKTVVIVDDNEAAADGLVRLLKAMGNEARAFYSGQSLLDALPILEADLVFIDIGMPEMDGYQVMAELKAKDFKVPAVALTGYGQSEDVEKALAAGFSNHLTKPIGAAELKAALEGLT